MTPATHYYAQLDELAERIVMAVTEEETASRLVVVNIDDEALASRIAQGAAWLEYPGQCKASWMSVTLASMPDEQVKEMLLLNFAKNPVAFENALLAQNPPQEKRLVTRVPQQHLAALANDITDRSMRGWPVRVVAFCADADVIVSGAKLFNVRHWAVDFEAAIRAALQSWRGGAPSDEHWDNSADAIASGIAGLCDCSFTAAQRMLLSIRKLYEAECGSDDGGPREPQEKLKSFHQRAVLRLLKSSAPDVYVRAESGGVLAELVYGLQRSSLLLGAEPSNDLAAVLGDEMPKGYKELANDLVFLRWYEEMSRPFPFSSPDEVADVNDSVTRRKKAALYSPGSYANTAKSQGFDEKIFLRKLGDALSDALDEQGPAVAGTSDNGNLQSAFIALVETMGGSAEYAMKIQRGLAVLGDSIDLEGVKRLERVADVLKLALVAPLDTLRDIRFAIVIKLLVKQLDTQVLPLLERWIKSCERKSPPSADLGVVADPVDEGIAGRLVGFISARIAPVFASAAATLSGDAAGPERATAQPMHADVGVSLLKDVTFQRNTIFEQRRKTLQDARHKVKSLVRDAARVLGDRMVLAALLKLSRSTSRRLDMSAEKLRFQLYLLGDSWMEAERHLSLLKLQVDSRAELSRADVILMEGGLLEARGQTRAAWQKYDALRSEIDPSVDPVVWTRASYGSLRTYLAMRSKPLDAALAGALSIVDLENQRRAGKALESQRRALKRERNRLFVSFRGPVREWARELGRRFIADIDNAEFDIDEMRRSTDDFDTTIQMRLLESKYIIIVLTRDYFESPWCINELHTALHLRRFNSDCELGWLFLNANVASGNRDDAELYVRAQFAVSSNINLGVNEQYLEERFRRLTELGTKIGKGVYAEGEYPDRSELTRFASRTLND